MHDLVGIETGYQLGYFGPELLRAAKACAADYHIVHTEQGLWAAARLLDAGLAVGVDFEDWYSEDLLPEARRHRPLRLLKALERQVARAAGHRTCPSRAMSAAMALELSCPPPVVVYNTFPLSDRRALDGANEDRRDRSRPSIHWFSQTLGRGRGLEELFAALALVRTPAEVHLRGRADKAAIADLTRPLPDAWQGRIFVHGLVPNRRLLSRIAEHDIGFAGEITSCRSRDLTATNKIFQYLLGGLAVVASDTAGQREVAAAGGESVVLYPSGDAAALARALDELLASPVMLNRRKDAALRIAQTTFCWERSAPALLQAVLGALGGPHPHGAP